MSNNKSQFGLKAFASPDEAPELDEPPTDDGTGSLMPTYLHSEEKILLKNLLVLTWISLADKFDHWSSHSSLINSQD